MIFFFFLLSMWKLILSYNSSTLKKYVIRVYIHNHVFIWMRYPYNNNIQFYVEKYCKFVPSQNILYHIYFLKHHLVIFGSGFPKINMLQTRSCDVHTPTKIMYFIIHIISPIKYIYIYMKDCTLKF